MSRIRVMIADDHNLVREGVIALLSFYPDLEVVGEASDGFEAVQKAVGLRPDVVLMDISMPSLGGLEATLEIKKSDPGIKILVLTQYDDKEYLSRFFQAGASGYILKKAMGSDLAKAIRSVARGESYLDPAVTSSIIEGFLEGKAEVRSLDLYEMLTGREKQILKLLAEGLTHKEIAALLDISTKTVISHQTHISDKLDLHSKADLIKFAIARGIIKL